MGGTSTSSCSVYANADAQQCLHAAWNHATTNGPWNAFSKSRRATTCIDNAHIWFRSHSIACISYLSNRSTSANTVSWLLQKWFKLGCVPIWWNWRPFGRCYCEPQIGHSSSFPFLLFLVFWIWKSACNWSKTFCWLNFETKCSVGSVWIRSWYN